MFLGLVAESATLAPAALGGLRATHGWGRASLAYATRRNRLLDVGDFGAGLLRAIPSPWKPGERLACLPRWGAPAGRLAGNRSLRPSARTALRGSAPQRSARLRRHRSSAASSNRAQFNCVDPLV